MRTFRDKQEGFSRRPDPNARAQRVCRPALHPAIRGAWMAGEASLDDRLAGSVPFQTMCAVAVAGWQMLRQARAEGASQAKQVAARFFAEHIAPEAAGLKPGAMAGAALLYELNEGDIA